MSTHQNQSWFVGRKHLPPSLSQALDQSHLPSLDGLRAFAAFLVVFYHCFLPSFPGGMGVLAFFVLSGFLITWLLLKEEERFGEVSLSMFYMRRCLRIIPAFYVYWLLLVGGHIVLERHLAIGQAIASLLYVGNYYQALIGDPKTGLSHTWSLGVEEQFYLLWPITFLWLRQNSRRVRFLLWAIAAVWLYRELLIFGFHIKQQYIYQAFDTRADHLMIGCLLAVALRTGIWAWLWRGLVAVPSTIWVTVGLLVCSAICTDRYGHYYRDAIGFIIDPVLIAVLIVQSLAHSSIAFGAVLNWRWVRYLGTISYSIYLYHGHAVILAQKVTGTRPWVWQSLAILTVVALASGSYWFVEQPFLRLRTRFTPGRKAPLKASRVADGLGVLSSPQADART
ncbi:MAG: acyltransferase [Acidobacteriaceae bacterium]|nr:acyltransferase [Acidobacteriaceae bacterium]